MTEQEAEDVGLLITALKTDVDRRLSEMELISDDDAKYNEAERKAQRCCYLITELRRYLEVWNDQAPYGRCKECDKPCTFDHAVPAEELVCDVCAGVPEDEIDW